MGQELAPNGTVRVVRIIDRLNVGGPAKHAVWLTTGLDAREFDSVLITGTVPPGEGDMSYFARAAGVEPVIIPQMSRELGARDLVVIAKLLRHLFKLRPHVIHTHKAKAGAAGRVAALLYKWLTPSALWLRPRRCVVVHTYHGHIFHSYYSPVKTKVFLAIERTLARFATDRIITISEQQRREIVEEFGVGEPRQARVIPLGIDLAELAPGARQLRQQLQLNATQPLLGIVGRLCEVKNHAMLLEAMAALQATNPQAHCVVIGDGHLRPELEALTQQLNLMGQVSFAGFRSDSTALYHELDLVALTSLNEGTPLTLIEALGCGRAVAATEVGGVVDLMGTRRAQLDGFSVWDHGVTAPSRRPQVFAHALKFLLERPELRREMGERGRAFIKRQYSRQRLVQDIEQLYRELLGVRGPVVAVEPPSTSYSAASS